MSKIAFTTLLNRADSVLSPHFGKAKWIMIRDDAGSITFTQNTGLNGHAVVEILRLAGCTDVISAEAGQGALHHLQEAGIGSWIAPKDVPVGTALKMFITGKLKPPVAGAQTAGCCCHGTIEEKSCQERSGCCG